MTMRPAVRTLALTAHVAFSVGWLGAVAAYLALAITGVAGADEQRVRAAYLAMEVTARFVLVPLALASLLSGLVSSLGTPWGLFRHYWVLFKLGLNVFATVILVMYTQSITYFAALAADMASSAAELRNPTHVIHSCAALLVLLVATVLAVYKPRGMTPYGWRKQRRTALAP